MVILSVFVLYGWFQIRTYYVRRVFVTKTWGGSPIREPVTPA